MNSNKSFSGVGSRQSPIPVLKVMTQIGQLMASKGWTLRSGGAKGADQAFELGCDLAEGKKEIYKASDDLLPDAFAIASKTHPAWDKCTEYAQRLHARNVNIVLGKNLDDPARLLICWTKGGKICGGTATAMRIAKKNNIMILNIAKYDDPIDATAEILTLI